MLYYLTFSALVGSGAYAVVPSAIIPSATLDDDEVMKNQVIKTGTLKTGTLRREKRAIRSDEEGYYNLPGDQRPAKEGSFLQNNEKKIQNHKKIQQKNNVNGSTKLRKKQRKSNHGELKNDPQSGASSESSRSSRVARNRGVSKGGISYRGMQTMNTNGLTRQSTIAAKNGGAEPLPPLKHNYEVSEITKQYPLPWAWLAITQCQWLAHLWHDTLNKCLTAENGFDIKTRGGISYTCNEGVSKACVMAFSSWKGNFELFCPNDPALPIARDSTCNPTIYGEDKNPIPTPPYTPVDACGIGPTPWRNIVQSCGKKNLEHNDKGDLVINCRRGGRNCTEAVKNWAKLYRNCEITEEELNIASLQKQKINGENATRNDATRMIDHDNAEEIYKNKTDNGSNNKMKEKTKTNLYRVKRRLTYTIDNDKNDLKILDSNDYLGNVTNGGLPLPDTVIDEREDQAIRAVLELKRIALSQKQCFDMKYAIAVSSVDDSRMFMLYPTIFSIVAGICLVVILCCMYFRHEDGSRTIKRIDRTDDYERSDSDSGKKAANSSSIPVVPATEASSPAPEKPPATPAEGAPQ